MYCKTNLQAIILLIGLLSILSETRILQLTSKNIPNVLKSQSKILALYHHPDCSYSQSYSQNFTAYHHSSSANLDQTVGMIDCSQEKLLCKNHNVSGYPVLAYIIESGPQSFVDPYLYLGQLDSNYKQEQYKAAQISALLKKSPHFIVGLFEQEGMPVPDGDKPSKYKHFNRFFYLSEGRVAKTLGGFVKNKAGCWLFKLENKKSGQLSRQYCGQTYQNSSQIVSNIQSLLSGSVKGNQLLDNSDYTNDTIIGYNETLYWLQHYSMQLQISTHSKISMCSFLYVWNEKCSHCDYESDMKLIKKIIQSQYAKAPRQSQVHYKKKLHSYDILVNGLNFIKYIMKKEELKISPNVGFGEFLIIPNLAALCFSTYDNRNLDSTVSFNMYKMDKIMALTNIIQFVDTVIQSHHKLAANSGKSTKLEGDEL